MWHVLTLHQRQGQAWQSTLGKGNNSTLDPLQNVRSYHTRSPLLQLPNAHSFNRLGFLSYLLAIVPVFQKFQLSVQQKTSNFYNSFFSILFSTKNIEAWFFAIREHYSCVICTWPPASVPCPQYSDVASFCFKTLSVLLKIKNLNSWRHGEELWLLYEAKKLRTSDESVYSGDCHSMSVNDWEDFWRMSERQ